PYTHNPDVRIFIAQCPADKQLSLTRDPSAQPQRPGFVQGVTAFNQLEQRRLGILPLLVQVCPRQVTRRGVGALQSLYPIRYGFDLFVLDPVTGDIRRYPENTPAARVGS